MKLIERITAWLDQYAVVEPEKDLNEQPVDSTDLQTRQLETLEKYLAEGDLLAADRITACLLCDGEDWTEPKPGMFEYIPIKTIDKMWVNASNGRFGFSVQLALADFVADSLDKAEIPSWYSHIDYQQSYSWDAPVGHLPHAWLFSEELGRDLDGDRVRRTGGEVIDKVRFWVFYKPHP